MGDEITDIWAFLAASPLLWLTMTLVVFQGSLWINRRLGGSPVLHPVLISMGILITILLLTGTDYDTYFDGAQFIHFLLGPATVALAVPLYENRQQIRALLWPLLVSGLAGAATAALSAVAIAYFMGAERVTLLSLAPKSVTSPIAMGVSEKLGGLPSLTAALVLLTGAIGCILAPWMIRLLRIRDDRVKGFAMGLSAHGFGTAQAFGISATAGAFAGLGLTLAGIMTAFLLPASVNWLPIRIDG
ncbi:MULTISPECIES: LrgB family protein [unclassified Ectothiorhodospira]|jgi:predicted murein hydrolase (TIGR00659 family)|uniref:LrgB family protein n=1 Tax=unclassified Ectothiorhodospira TaxID=2684909 RepID=UPI001EE7A9BD|nr:MULTISPECIES: LrgB family protein [unclassified Ectothiorhodospira]MCG5514532.1 LrgB family protein [Ectothiorhodospira sp. 9100]MCG5518664.1 LrgB family protein [Ectothiorhodospira sp. 9905]